LRGSVSTVAIFYSMIYCMQLWGYVYILASKKNGILYIWVTNNLVRRIYEHRKLMVDGFTKKYFIKKLVYYEEYNSIAEAIYREKQMKWGNRKNKIS